MLAGSVLLVALQSAIKQQALFGNFPMLLRWNFHRMMLAQSMNFYQDEFAGRIATKVMQTALAVRDTWLIVCELIVFIVIYFVTLLAVLGDFDPRLLMPFLVWLALYLLSLRYFVPRLGRVAQAAGRRALADDRPHHRRVHQHRDGQALLAREARGGLRARRDAGVPRDGARADAARHRLRDRQSRAVDGRSSRPRRARRCGCGRKARSASARSRRRRRWRCA